MGKENDKPSPSINQSRPPVPAAPGINEAGSPLQTTAQPQSDSVSSASSPETVPPGSVQPPASSANEEATNTSVEAASSFPDLDPETRRAFDDVIAAIQVHGEELINLPNVVSVRPGYRFQNAQITSQPALIVTVLRKLDLPQVSARQLIPSKLGKVVVDVLAATPFEQLKFIERQRPAGIIDTTLPGEDVLAGLGAAAASTLRDYVPPAEPLAEVNEEMTIVCHASPDAGWSNLRSFIEGTQEQMTATMYEFNARHILDALIQSLKSPRTLRLILDGGAPNDVPGSPASAISKADARLALETALKQRLTCVWAPVADDGKTTVSFFPSAYHIKVAVRDGVSFWLSSGNWKESGQPKLDPINGPLPPGFNKTSFLNKHNREWHVIIHNRTLAKLFETFINHDITQATPLQKPVPGAPQPAAMPDLFIPEPIDVGFAAITQSFFPHSGQEFKKKVRIQPLMTPDNFPEFILPLIRSAKKSLYFQNQSLKSSPSNTRYTPLFQALRDQSKKASQTFDVKILVSEFTDVSVLKASGFNTDCIKTQNECHNKGIIIDDKIVVVGSHNWTGQGATRNRDASLIIHDEEIAAYFKRFFLFDWNRIPEGQHLVAPPMVALPGESTPPGMIRAAWHEVFPDWRDGLLN